MYVHIIMIKKTKTKNNKQKNTHKHKTHTHKIHKKPTENNNKNSAEILPCYCMCY